MSVPGYAHGIQMSFLATMNTRAHAARLAKAADTVQTVQITPSPNGASVADKTASSSDNTFLSDVLDVINPLQHIPVVSTVYRAVTGDKIGDVERVAGDTLYGGLMGLGSSLANIAFRDLTGKDFGDTALAWLGLDGTAAAPTALASLAAPSDKSTGKSTGKSAGKPAAAQPPATKLAKTAPAAAAVTPAQTAAPIDPAAIMATLKAQGIDPALGLRALSAYRNMLGLSDAAKATINASH